MKRVLLVLVLMAWPAIALAQYGPSGSYGSAPYQPAVPQAPAVAAYGGYPGYYGGGGGTAAGNALNGMGNVISAKGNYNLSTSAAAINMTQAQKNEIQNHMDYTNTYFQMKDVNQAYQRSHAGPRLTQAQINAIEHSRLPKSLDASQLNPETGALSWPPALQLDAYATDRATLDDLSTKRISYGSLGYPDQLKSINACKSILGQLKGQIRDIPTNDYMSSERFVKGLVYVLSGTTL